MKNHSLLASLQDLYKIISKKVIRNRMHSYHKHVGSNGSFDITSVLNKQIDSLSTVSSDNNIDSTNVRDEERSEKPITAKVQNQEFQYTEKENISGVESEFAKYLKQKKSSSASHPYLSEKLKATVWEHIHNTIRYAKQDNIATAKLHADIAGQALEEAAHYMSDEEYSNLIFQVEECFMISKKEKRKGV